MTKHDKEGFALIAAGLLFPVVIQVLPSWAVQFYLALVAVEFGYWARPVLELKKVLPPEADWASRAAVIASELLLLFPDNLDAKRDREGKSLGHLRWMCIELAHKNVGSATKTCRWLGYVQCAMIYRGLTTLEAEKERNLRSK